MCQLTSQKNTVKYIISLKNRVGFLHLNPVAPQTAEG